MAHPTQGPRKGTTPRDRRVLAAAAALCLLPACAQKRAERPTDSERPATNAGLAALTNEKTAPPPTLGTPPPDDFRPTRDIVEQYAALYDQIWASAEQSTGGTPVQTWDPSGGSASPSGRSGERAGPDSTTPTTPDPATSPSDGDEGPTRFSLLAFAGDDDANTSISEATGHAATEMSRGPGGGDGGEAGAVTPVAVNPEQRKQQLLEELVGVLGELALSGDGPGSSALALAGLEAVRPDALSALKGQGVLSEAEVASLDAARELFRAMSARGGIADPGEVSSVLDRIRRDLDARAGLRIARAELCTSVTGFGRYETFSANRFIAGRAQPVIVYTEIDRFGHRESRGSDGAPRYEIELSQRLELYHVADNLNTWNRAAEMDKTVSRNLVRDYYLINQVTLPANLSIGKYHLKVVMRDLVSGNLAETIIPIEIVAGGR